MEKRIAPCSCPITTYKTDTAMNNAPCSCPITKSTPRLENQQDNAYRARVVTCIESTATMQQYRRYHSREASAQLSVTSTQLGKV